MVVVREVIAGDDIDARILLDLPVLETQSFTLGKELVLRQFASPVCFCRLLEITVDSLAREAEY